MNNAPDISAETYLVSAGYWGMKVRDFMRAGDVENAWNLAIVAGSCANAYLRTQKPQPWPGHVYGDGTDCKCYRCTGRTPR